MPTTSSERIEHFYAAVAEGDLAVALGLLGDRIEWHEAPGMPYRAQQPYHGADEVAQRVLGPINTDVEDLRLQLDELIELGPHVAALGHYAGTARASRCAIDQRFVHIWTLDPKGCVSEFRQYTNATRFKRALHI